MALLANSPAVEPGSHAPPAINLAMVADCCGGDDEAMDEILRIFIAAVKMDLERLAEAIARNNVEDARFLVHRIRGAARAVDAVRILASGDSVDSAVASGNWGLAGAEMTRLCGDFREADRFLARHRL